jgi:Fur family transcriptional regulator, iron response regulator
MGMQVTQTESVREKVLAKLYAAGLRPTRQRLALGSILWREGDRHFTAERLHQMALADRFNLSLATVYNTLHQFVEAGLLQEFRLENGRSVFDTNTSFHHHFVCEEKGELTDIPAEQINITSIPAAPEGCEIIAVEVHIRTRRVEAPAIEKELAA